MPHPSLKARGEAIARRWCELVFETYPDQTVHFLNAERDPFRNPVGATISSEIGSLCEALLEGAGEERLRPHLDAVIRIRNVQDFGAGQAVGFVFLLKRAVREELGASEAAGLSDALTELDGRIDRAALLGFDCYAACKEQLNRIRFDEMKRRVYWLERTHPACAPLEWDEATGSEAKGTPDTEKGTDKGGKRGDG